MTPQSLRRACLVAASSNAVRVGTALVFVLTLVCGSASGAVPIVTRISPYFGPVGQWVYVFGSGFVNGATKASVGGVTNIDCYVYAPDQLGFTVPVGASGTTPITITTSFGSAQSSDRYTVGIVVAPTISRQPMSQQVVAGTDALFTIAADGTSPFTYQWRKNGTAISGATNATLTLPRVNSTAAGSYTVVVSNIAGSSTSNVATLTVNVAPAIRTQPTNQTAIVGTSVSFTVASDGTPPLSYQWRKDGTAISGATSTTLAFNNAQTADAGTYTVQVNNTAGGVVSNGVSLTVLTAGIAPAITTQPTGRTENLGTNLSFSVVTTGFPVPSFQWLKAGVPIAGSTNASVNFSNVRTSDAGTYTVTATNSVGSVTSNAAVLTILSPGRLGNLSIRTATTAGSGTLIVGFVVGGSGTSGLKPLLLRAAGPALGQFGVTGTLPDPFLSLFDNGGRFLASNDNWDDSVAARVSGVGAFAFPASSKDSALFSSVAGSSYTAMVIGVGDAVGVALAEVYDTSESISISTPRLINLSARARVGTEAEIMIAGFIVKGNTPVTVLFRAVGPTLAQFAVTGILENPRLTLYQDAALVATNDDWSEVGSATISEKARTVGAFSLPVGSRDSALLATLQPGAYTVQVSGVGNTTGIALVEIYEVP